MLLCIVAATFEQKACLPVKVAHKAVTQHPEKIWLVGGGPIISSSLVELWNPWGLDAMLPEPQLLRWVHGNSHIKDGGS